MLRNINDQYATTTKQFHDLRYTSSTDLFIDNQGQTNVAYLILNFDVDYVYDIDYTEPADWESLHSTMYPGNGSGTSSDHLGNIIVVPQEED